MNAHDADGSVSRSTPSAAARQEGPGPFYLRPSAGGPAPQPQALATVPGQQQPITRQGSHCATGKWERVPAARNSSETRGTPVGGKRHLGEDTPPQKQTGDGNSHFYLCIFQNSFSWPRHGSRMRWTPLANRRFQILKD